MDVKTLHEALKKFPHHCIKVANSDEIGYHTWGANGHREYAQLEAYPTHRIWVGPSPDGMTSFRTTEFPGLCGIRVFHGFGGQDLRHMIPAWEQIAIDWRYTYAMCSVLTLYDNPNQKEQLLSAGWQINKEFVNTRTGHHIAVMEKKVR